jgi:hypothetical protein
MNGVFNLSLMKAPDITLPGRKDAGEPLFASGGGIGGFRLIFRF